MYGINHAEDLKCRSSEIMFFVTQLARTQRQIVLSQKLVFDSYQLACPGGSGCVRHALIITLGLGQDRQVKGLVKLIYYDFTV